MSLNGTITNGHDKNHDVVDVVVGLDANVNKEDKGSYMANYKAHKPGISHDEMVDAYTEWANNYDKDLCPGIYNGPIQAAERLAQLFDIKVRENLKILDVAAGTGRVGYELYNLGFRHIDALEPSSGMLRVLSGRNIYEKTYQTLIGHSKSNEIVPPKTYDCLVIAGGMGEGHIPVNAVKEMIRIVKCGGIILIVMREEYLSYVKEYVDSLEPFMLELEQLGFWKQISRTIAPEYSFNKNGIIYVYEVMSESFPE